MYVTLRKNRDNISSIIPHIRIVSILLLSPTEFTEILCTTSSISSEGERTRFRNYLIAVDLMVNYRYTDDGFHQIIKSRFFVTVVRFNYRNRAKFTQITVLPPQNLSKPYYRTPPCITVKIFNCSRRCIVMRSYYLYSKQTYY